MIAFTNGSSRAVTWMPVEFGRLLGELLGVSPDAVSTDVAQHPEIWGDLCGWYHIPIPMTAARARLNFGAGTEVFIRHGELRLRFLSPVPVMYRGFPLHPDAADDPFVFALDFSQWGMGKSRVVFSRARDTGRMSLHFDAPQPVSFRRQPEATNPRLWLRRASAVIAAVTAARAVSRRRRRRAERASNSDRPCETHTV